MAVSKQSSDFQSSAWLGDVSGFDSCEPALQSFQRLLQFRDFGLRHIASCKVLLDLVEKLIAFFHQFPVFFLDVLLEQVQERTRMASLYWFSP